MFLQEFAGDIGAQGTPYAADLKAVGQTVVDKYAAGKREDLCLVLHPAEGGRKDETVEVALEFSAAFGALLVAGFLAEAFVGDELFPVHSHLMVRACRGRRGMEAGHPANL